MSQNCPAVYGYVKDYISNQKWLTWLSHYSNKWIHWTTEVVFKVESRVPVRWLQSFKGNKLYYWGIFDCISVHTKFDQMRDSFSIAILGGSLCAVLLFLQTRKQETLKSTETKRKRNSGYIFIFSKAHCCMKTLKLVSSCSNYTQHNISRVNGQKLQCPSKSDQYISETYTAVTWPRNKSWS